MLPHVRMAADYLIALRAQRMTADYRSGEHAACFGLLPESASHEGYLAHPVHSYWDDFWGVRGLEAAADLAEAAGLTDDASRWQPRSRALPARSAAIASTRSSPTNNSPTSRARSSGRTSIPPPPPTPSPCSISPTSLPTGPLHAMLATYLDGFRRKHRGEMPWNNYTAYEIRIIGAFVRLGKRDNANELLEFFLSDRRPREWNQWPEITWRDPRSPGHLGDVPHTWIAAEYLLALASMVAAEREATASLVLASGMPWAWIAPNPGFAVRNLPTRYGPLDFRIRALGTDAIEVAIGDSIRLPPGGLSIVPPLPPGKRLAGGGEAIPVEALPFQATVRLIDVPV